MANEFIARKGIISLGDSKITGSLNISQNLTVNGTLDATFNSSTGTAISGAFTQDSSSLASRVADLESFDANLDNTYATDAQVSTAVSALNAATSSYLQNTTDTLTGNLTVTGTITAQEFHTEYISGSIIYTSGSTKFGDSSDDIHRFTGSLQVSGSLDLQAGNATFSGDVGIGQTGNAKLEVVSTSGEVFRADSSGGAYRIVVNQTGVSTQGIFAHAGNATFTGIIKADSSSTGDYVRLYGSSGTGQWDIYGNGENLRFSENSGGGGNVVVDTNLGIGGSPSSWNATSKAIQLPQYASLSHQHNASLNLMSFALETSANTFTYADTGVYPLRYNQDPNNGAHTWHVAASGTSGNTISWTTAMRMNVNGNVGIGTTDNSYRLRVSGDNGAYWNGSSYTGGTPLAVTIDNRQNGGYDSVLLFQQADSGGTIKNAGGIGMVGKASWTAGNDATQISDMYFLVRNNSGGVSERMRLTTTGILQLGSNSTPSLTSNFFISRGDQYGFHIHTQTGFTRLVGSDDYLYLGTGANTSTITITGGNVGIGATSPDAIFHIAKSNAGGLGGQIVIDNPAASTLGNTVEISFLTDSGASGSGVRNGRIKLVNENAGNGAANMQFWTWNGSSEEERMRIDSSGNMGIGETNPEVFLFAAKELHIKGGTGTNQAAMVAVNSGQSANGFVGGYAWINDSATNELQKRVAQITVDADSGGADTSRMEFYTKGGAGDYTERMRIDSSGNVILYNGNTLFVESPGTGRRGYLQTNSSGTKLSAADTSGEPLFLSSPQATGNIRMEVGGQERARFTPNGITFNGDTAAANALDDYEEGTWTPSVQRITSNPTVSYSYRVGSYTKIGNMVYIFFDLLITSNSGGSGPWIIEGLPYTVSSYLAGYSVTNWRDCSAISGASSGGQLKGFVNQNTTYIYIQIDKSGTDGFGYQGDGSVGTGRITGCVYYHI